jgi:hypothetical protein
MGSTVSPQAAASPPPLRASSAEQHRINVSATDGWQGNIWVPAGTWVTVQAPSVGGYWTVDYRPEEGNLPPVSARGYPDDSRVWSGNTTCKIDPRYPYGALLYRLGENRPGTAAGSDQFVAPSDSYLNFSINDRCRGDNAGSLPVTVVIG